MLVCIEHFRHGESAKSTPRLERRQSVPPAEPLGTTRTTVSSYPQYFTYNVCSRALGSLGKGTMIGVALEPPPDHRCLHFLGTRFYLVPGM